MNPSQSQKKHLSTPKGYSFQWLTAVSVLFFALTVAVIALIPPFRTNQPENLAKIQVKLVPKKSKAKQIIEAPLKETIAPKDPRFKGHVDHQTAKETKVKNPRQNGNNPDNPMQKLTQKLRNAQSKPQSIPKTVDGPSRKVPDNIYSQLLPQIADLPTEPGFQDHINDDDIAVGAVIDVNTTEYRWIGYFTNVRKMVNQAFFSPAHTVKRSKRIQNKLQMYGRAEVKGRAVVQLTILRSGFLIKSKLVSSSGDREVDEFWEKVLNMAAPYPPLPKHYDKDKLTFKYAFDYHLFFQEKKAFDDPSFPPKSKL